MIKRPFVLASVLSVGLLGATVAVAQDPPGNSENAPGRANGGGSCITADPARCGNSGVGQGPVQRFSEDVGAPGNTGAGNRGNQFGNDNKNSDKGNAGCSGLVDTEFGELFACEPLPF